jgi:glutathione S-transferase
MILVGQYDSPYTRRVAVSLLVLGLGYEHDTRSVFGDFASMSNVNPLRRVPSLVLDDGAVLVESGAILDWIDQTVGPERALVPPSGIARRRVLHLVALATGAMDKAAALALERTVRPKAYRWPEWTERCRTQAADTLAALDAEPWPAEAPLDQAQISTTVMIRHMRMADPRTLPPGRYPALDGLSERCEARPAFKATYPAEYVIPQGA